MRLHSPDFTSPKYLWYVENTTNKGGGACWDLDEIKKIKETCIENNLKLHPMLDLTFKSVFDDSDFGKLFDTISVCLSKGFGSPVGSVLILRRSIKKIMKIRKFEGNDNQAICSMWDRHRKK